MSVRSDVAALVRMAEWEREVARPLRWYVREPRIYPAAALLRAALRLMIAYGSRSVRAEARELLGRIQ